MCCHKFTTDLKIERIERYRKEMNSSFTLITLFQVFEANKAWLPSMLTDQGPVLLPGLWATGLGPGLPFFGSQDGNHVKWLQWPNKKAHVI